MVYSMLVVANNKYEDSLPDGIDWIKFDNDLEIYYAVYSTDLVDSSSPWRHDSRALARVVIDLLEERTGPLVE